jgi:polyhydroxybutyrate depolymerase
MSKLPFVLLAALPLVFGCSDGDGGAGGGGGAGGSGGTGGMVFSADPPLVLAEEERPAMVAIPSDYDPEVSYPLLLLLHGAGVTGRIQAGFFLMFDAVEEKDFVLVYPDGIDNVWNATPACCDPTGEVDDVGYLSGLIEEAKQVYNIDEDRVYLMGHSNGGFMSFRMACERSDLFTAMVSLAGSTFQDPADCQPADPPVSVLIAHSPQDPTVAYEGIVGEDGYPGAIEVAERFREQAGCLDDPTVLPDVDLTDDWPGAETERVSYQLGCDEGLDVELWTIVTSEETCTRSTCNPHIPVFTDAWADTTIDWLFQHSR